MITTSSIDRMRAEHEADRHRFKTNVRVYAGNGMAVFPDSLKNEGDHVVVTFAVMGNDTGRLDDWRHPDYRKPITASSQGELDRAVRERYGETMKRVYPFSWACGLGGTASDFGDDAEGHSGTVL